MNAFVVDTCVFSAAGSSRGTRRREHRLATRNDRTLSFGALPATIDGIPITDPVQQWWDLRDLGGEDRLETAPPLPEAPSTGGGRRGARLGAGGNRAARRAVGLEAAPHRPRSDGASSRAGRVISPASECAGTGAKSQTSTPTLIIRSRTFQRSWTWPCRSHAPVSAGRWATCRS